MPTCNVDTTSQDSTIAVCPREDDAFFATVVVPLVVHCPSRSAAPLPVRFGVPLPRGRLRGEHFAASLACGEQRIEAQATPLCRWSDASVRWLLVDALPSMPFEPGDRAALHVSPTNRPIAPGVKVHSASDAWTISTGVAEFVVDGRTFRPFRGVRLANRDIQIEEASRLDFVDAKRIARDLAVEHVAIESAGLVRTTLRLDGAVVGPDGLRWHARLSFFTGSGLVCLRFAVHNPHAARHPGGIWDLGDRGSRFFRELSLRLSCPPGEGRRVHWWIEPNAQDRTGERVSIYQGSSGGENWQSLNHVDRAGRVPCVVPGFVEDTARGQTSGSRAQPVVAIESERARVGVAMPWFWQQFPKAIDAGSDEIRFGIFPGRWSEQSLFELQGGERKTHTLWMHFDSQSPRETIPLDGVAAPVQIQAEPAWICDSGAIDGFVPEADDPDLRFRDYASQAICGPWSVFAGRETVDEYGWRNFGDVWANHEALYYRGPAPIASHYNNQFDYLNGALLAWLRGGDARWREVFEPLAEHVMDIDRYHTAADRAAYNGGLFWFTDHYLTAATSTHRTYSRANAPADGSPYGGGPGSEHNFATGLLHDYFLTGEHDARDAVLGLADWVIAMEDGRATVLGIVDGGPTGLASAHWGGDPKPPGRGAANSIQVLLDAWLLDRDARYLQKAEELIGRSIHPRDDLAAFDLLNAEKCWSYTMFLAALDRYLAVKAEAGQVDDRYAYAQASFVHYATWMLERERPYLDRRDELEFPTEAWAAQEFRKANVLRRAARHVDEPVAARMLERGNALAERAWKDLLAFDTQATARAMAVLLTEGLWDAFLRTTPRPAAPRYDGAVDFGAPQPFRSQRHRVKQRLTNVRGLVELGVAALTYPLRRAKSRFTTR